MNTLTRMFSLCLCLGALVFAATDAKPSENDLRPISLTADLEMEKNNLERGPSLDYDPSSRECADTFIAFGVDPNGSYDSCWTDGSGYFYFYWEGGCLALDITYSGGTLDLSTYGFTEGFYFYGFDPGATEDFVMTFDDGSAGASTATSECATCEELGQITCWDGSCADSEADCPEEGDCGDGFVIDCVDTDCCPESWIGDGYEDCEDQQYGCDLTCYDNDGGDCGGAFSHNSGPKIEQLPNHSFIMIDEVGNMDNSEFSRDLEGYFIYRGLVSGGTDTPVDYVDVGITSYTDEGLANGVEYFYVVTASYSEGESGPSNEASATPAEFEPIAPTNLQADAGDSQVQLTWDAPEDDGGGGGGGGGGGDGNTGPQSLVGETVSLFLPDYNIYFDVEFTEYGGGNSGGAFAWERSCVKEEIIGCQVATACNYNDSATLAGDCTYTDGICESCSGETDGSGTVVDNDADDDGVCDELSSSSTIEPSNFSIVSIYPNPFNPSTTISFTLDQFSNVEMQIYNLRGELIENLINERLNVGRHSIIWNADSYSVGTYLLKIKAGHQVDARKLVLIK